MIVHRDNASQVGRYLGLPCVLKQPDSAFSQGVVKVELARRSWTTRSRVAWRSSDLVIAQEFMPTDFDWRVGVLDGKPLYACRYFMAHAPLADPQAHAPRAASTAARRDHRRIERAPREVVRAGASPPPI